ncbi:MAG: aldehyde dehydrogenase family protein [Eubacterium sp.]|nr:aldehyde dehydrogenase family protein [Candidatus Colimonas fimequi]
MNLNIIDNDLLSIQEARILAENAYEAQQTMATFTQDKLDVIVERIAEEVSKHAKELAKMSANETDYGKWEDKYIKNRFACEYLPAHLRGMKCVGIVDKDDEKQIMDIGVPMGVLVSLCPATSPVSTTIYNTLIAIKSGNAIIFSPHPRAVQTIAKVLDIMIQAAEGYGLPEGAISYLQTVTKSGTIELMNHKSTALIMNTGVPDMLDYAYQSGKPVIYGGAGNGPAFIERTANINQAVLDIIASKTFDNGVASAAEQAVVVDSAVEPQVREAFKKNGAYFMTEDEAARLGKLFYFKDGTLNPELSGKCAKDLAKWAEIPAPDDVKLLIAEQRWVAMNNPYSKGKLLPVLAYYIEDDWMNACEKCIELLLTERQGHTLVIHSNDPEVIEQFAIKKPVGRMLVNTPAVFGSMGATTNLFPAMTLGSGSAGQGITSDNVSPKNLTYIRKVGYGVRRIEQLGLGTPADSVNKSNTLSDLDINSLQTLQKLLEAALANINK